MENLLKLNLKPQTSITYTIKNLTSFSTNTGTCTDFWIYQNDLEAIQDFKEFVKSGKNAEFSLEKREENVSNCRLRISIFNIKTEKFEVVFFQN